MHVVIMGCGRVGSTLARGLEARGHTTAVIDQNPDAFRRLGPSYTGSTVTGRGFDREVLQRARIDVADAFAAVSSGDNSNIISARVAREQFGVTNVVARIYDPGRAEVYERLGIPTVASVKWAADQMLRRLVPKGDEPIWRDPSGTVRCDQILTPPVWVGHPVRLMQDTTGGRISHLTRLGSGLIPKRETIIQEGDLVSIFMREDESDAVLDRFHRGPEDDR